MSDSKSSEEVKKPDIDGGGNEDQFEPEPSESEEVFDLPRIAPSPSSPDLSGIFLYHLIT